MLKASSLLNFLAAAILSGIILCLSGCTNFPHEKQDPYQNINRVTWGWNMAFDHMILRPVASTYIHVVPVVVRKGVTNFFQNTQMTTTVINDVLQFKFHWAFVDLWRFIVNSTVGVLGIFDVATRLGFPRHYEDFGMTLSYYDGGRPQPYLVLPFFGSNTLNSAIGLPVDYFTEIWPYIKPSYVKYIAASINIVNTRANYMDANKLLDESFDPYVFMRNAYMQRRRRLIRENRKPYKTLTQRRHEESQQQIQHTPPPPPLILPGTTAVGDEHAKETGGVKDNGTLTTPPPSSLIQKPEIMTDKKQVSNNSLTLSCCNGIRKLDKG